MGVVNVRGLAATRAVVLLDVLVQILDIRFEAAHVVLADLFEQAALCGLLHGLFGSYLRGLIPLTFSLAGLLGLHLGERAQGPLLLRLLGREVGGVDLPRELLLLVLLALVVELQVLPLLRGQFLGALKARVHPRSRRYII